LPSLICPFLTHHLPFVFTRVPPSKFGNEKYRQTDGPQLARAFFQILKITILLS